MRIKEELVKISSILADEGYPELAGEMMRYALAEPEKHWGDDTDFRDEVESTSQVSRAVEYLSFQLLLPEKQIQEVEQIASSLNDSDTSIVFVQPEIAERDEPAEKFSLGDRKETWTSARRDRTVRFLEYFLAKISKENNENAT